LRTLYEADLDRIARAYPGVLMQFASENADA
jgi:hypothetical protein